jgi:hypothetical protein
MKLKIVWLPVIFSLLSQICFARPAVYFDSDDDHGYYITDGKKKISPHWGNFKDAQPLFESNPKALEFYEEYEKNLSSMWTSYWNTTGAYVGSVVWIASSNTTNPSASWTGFWISTGGYLVIVTLVTGFFVRKAQYNLIKAVNTINGVYSSGDSSSPKLSVDIAPTSDSTGGKFLMSYTF